MTAPESAAAGPAKARALRVPAARRAERIADGGLLAFLALTPFSVTLSQIAAGVALVSWLAGRAAATAAPPAFADLARRPLGVALAAFAAASALAAARAPDPVLAFRGLAGLAAFGILFLARDRLSDPRRALRAAAVALAAGVVAALHGIAQPLLHGAEYRAHGALSHYMTYSGVVLLLLTLALALAVHGPRRRAPAAWIATALLGAALLLTQTRSAWLGAVAAGTLIAALRRKRLVAALALVALAALALGPRTVRDRARSIVDPGYPTNVERVYMWRAGWAVLRERPLSGIGPGNMPSQWERYRLPGDPSPEDRPPAHLHSNLVQIAAERGLLGLGAWIALWTAWAVSSVRSLRRARGSAEPERAWTAPVVAGLAAGVAFHVSGLFEYNAGDSEVADLLYVLAALPLAAERAVSARWRRSPP